jgi:hypothetical protein
MSRSIHASRVVGDPRICLVTIIDVEVGADSREERPTCLPSRLRSVFHRRTPHRARQF